MIVGTFPIYNESHLVIPQMEQMLYFCDEVIVLCDNSPPETMRLINAYREKNVQVIYTPKEDNQLQRDEWGDRKRLWDAARELGCTTYFHSDTDELFDLKSTSRVKSILEHHNKTSAYCFTRYDFWGDMHSYRIPYNTDEHAGKHVRYIPKETTTYIMPVLDGMGWPNVQVPNFHARREPVNCPEPIHVPGVRIKHYGYWDQKTIDLKEEFYKPTAAGDVWGHDMQVTKEEYLERWGMGYFER